MYRPSQENAKRLKIENVEESDVVNPPEVDDVELRNEEGEEGEEVLDEKPEIDWKPAISFRKLAIQIETLAFNINLENFFRETTLRTVRLFKANDQAVPIQDFNQLFNVFLTSLKTGRTQNSNENSMQLSRIFKQLQRNLIRPLGINGGCSRNS
ncbi:hypothetical protein B9Z55_027565 [Caenorhabditis nigoni]|uniref:SPK domain-containing protein n=1 Tax=Caenorhabditis nigoni TaxID=1611254 RepID=A0A2G5SFP6_9PELO|nr:hypothetical protein B9Z55_027565 [Caenorhabditis nigoni]